MRSLAVVSVVTAAVLVLGAATVASARPATALGCLAGELRPTMAIKPLAGHGKSVRLTILNIGHRCRFQTIGVIVNGGGTRNSVSSKHGAAIVIPQNRSLRALVVWRNWCGSVGPSQIVLRIWGKGKELALPYFPAPACVHPNQKTTVVVGKPALVSR